MQEKKSDVEDEPMVAVENVYQKSKSKKKEDAEKEDDEELFNKEMLHTYYSRLFPYEMFHSWLSYGASSTNKNNCFSHREFSFTLKTPRDEEIYARYQSFSTSDQLKNALLKQNPIKIDIGAVFSHPPKDKNSISEQKFHPEKREFILDIDMTDYDDVRKCGCTGAQMCHVCWPLMEMALLVVEKSLRDDFGFRHILWVYSGRRGIHGWVCDSSALGLTNDARSAIASYLELNLNSEKNKNAMSLSLPLHPSFQRAFDILEPYFLSNVLPSENGHGVLASSEEWDKILDTLPDCAQKVREKLKAEWDDETTPVEKWEELKDLLKIIVGAQKKNKSKKVKTFSASEVMKAEVWPYETVFTHTYPRLDINVSKMRNHLLKSPFCVHPKTGRVCVPIADIQKFDPFQDAPTLPQLMKELNESKKEDSGDKDNTRDDTPQSKSEEQWKNTSLKESFEYFQNSFLSPLQSSWRARKRDEREQQAAFTGDF